LAYATVDDVKKYIARFPLTDATKPTETQVEGILTDIAAEVDFLIYSLGYDLPIPETATTTAAFFKKLVSVGTAGYIILSNQPMTEYGTGVGSLALRYIGIYHKYYDRLQNGFYKLVDVPARAGTKAESLFGKPACNYSSEDAPIFEREPIDDFKIEDFDI